MFVSLFKYSSYSFILECAWQYLHFGCDINGTSFPGIDVNDTMKVFGKGGADVVRNKPGDLNVTIKVWFLFFFSKIQTLYVSLISSLQMNFVFIFLVQIREDPVFRREGNHVHVDAIISIAQVTTLSVWFPCLMLL